MTYKAYELLAHLNHLDLVEHDKGVMFVGNNKNWEEVKSEVAKHEVAEKYHECGGGENVES